MTVLKQFLSQNKTKIYAVVQFYRWFVLTRSCILTIPKIDESRIKEPMIKLKRIIYCKEQSFVIRTPFGRTLPV